MKYDNPIIRCNSKDCGDTNIYIAYWPRDLKRCPFCDGKDVAPYDLFAKHSKQIKERAKIVGVKAIKEARKRYK